MAWSGTIIQRTPRIITLQDYHPVKLGPDGISDLVGWSPLLLAEQRYAIFTAIECKAGRGKNTDTQDRFQELVRSCGGRAGVARSVDDARQIVIGTI